MKSTWIIAGMLTLQSGAVLAADRVDNLPSSGNVMLMGTVQRIADRDTFILRDDAGNTIDVHTNAALQVRNGERVQVNGTVQSEALGIGREVVNARVSPIAGDRVTGGVGGPYEPLDENTGVNDNTRDNMRYDQSPASNPTGTSGSYNDNSKY